MPLAWWGKRSTYQKCVFVVSLCTAIFIITYSSINHFNRITIGNPPPAIVEPLPNSTRVRRKVSFENNLNENSTSSAGTGKAVIVGPIIIGTTGTPFNGTVVIYDGEYKIAEIHCTVGSWKSQDPDPETKNLINTLLNDTFKDTDLDSYFVPGSSTDMVNRIRAMIEGDSEEESFLIDSQGNRPLALPLELAPDEENFITPQTGILIKGVYNTDSHFNGTAIARENGYKMTEIHCKIGQVADHVPSPKLIDLVKNITKAISPDYDENDVVKDDHTYNSLHPQDTISQHVIEQESADSQQDFSLNDDNFLLEENIENRDINNSESMEGETVTYPTKVTTDTTTTTESAVSSSTTMVIIIVTPSSNTSVENSTSLVANTGSSMITPKLSKAVMKIIESIAKKPYSILLPPLEVMENVPFSPIFDQKFIKAAVPMARGMSADLTGFDGDLRQEIKLRKMLESSTVLGSESANVSTTSVPVSSTEDTTGSSTTSEPLSTQSNTTVEESGSNGTNTNNSSFTESTSPKSYMDQENTTDHGNMSTVDQLHCGGDSDSDSGKESSCGVCAGNKSRKRAVIDDKLTNMDKFAENPIFSNVADDKAFQAAIEINEDTLKEPNVIFPEFMATLEVLGNAPGNPKLSEAAVPLGELTRSTDLVGGLKKRVMRSIKSRSNRVSNLAFALKPRIFNDAKTRFRRQSKNECKIKGNGSNPCKDISDALEEKAQAFASTELHLSTSTEHTSTTECYEDGSTTSSHGSSLPKGSAKPDESGTDSQSSPSGSDADSQSSSKAQSSAAPGESGNSDSGRSENPNSTGGSGEGEEAGNPSTKNSLPNSRPESSSPEGTDYDTEISDRPSKAKVTSEPSSGEGSDTTMQGSETPIPALDERTTGRGRGSPMPQIASEKKDKCDKDSSTGDKCGGECSSAGDKCGSESDSTSCGDDSGSCGGGDDFCNFGDGGCNKKKIVEQKLGDVVVPLEKEKPILSKDDSRHKRTPTRKSIGNLWQIFNNRFERIPNALKFDANDSIKKFRHVRSPPIRKILRRNLRSADENGNSLNTLQKMNSLIESLNAFDNPVALGNDIPVENLNI